MILNLARLQNDDQFNCILAGPAGSAENIAYFARYGITGVILDGSRDRLNDIIVQGCSFAAVLHRAGEESSFWDRFVPVLRAHGAKVVLDANVFGNVDKGPVSGLTDLVVCNSLHTLWRHWTAMGRPNIDTYLQTHRVIYNPVVLNPGEEEISTARRRMRHTLGIPDDSVVFFDICRPTPKKLDWMVVDVLDAIAREQKNVYMIARSFPEVPARALRRSMGERFHNLPVSIDEGEVFATIAAGDVLVHLSSMGESFGMAIAEAMRCGRPVIANATPSPNQSNAQVELVRHGETGCVVTGAATALAAVRMLANDGQKRTRMGAAGRVSFCSGPFNPQTIANAFNSEINARWEGKPPMEPREPSMEACKRYLLEYRPSQYREPARVAGVSPLWAFKADAARLLWRATRRFER